MKNLIFFIFVLIIITSCNPYFNLSRKIQKEQTYAWVNSPYNEQKIDFVNNEYIYRNPQIKFRQHRLESFLKHRQIDLSKIADTLILLESYNALCIACPSERFEIFYDDSVFVYNWQYGQDEDNFNTTKFKLNLHSTDYEYKLSNSEFLELIPKIRNGEKWYESTLDYGSKFCLGGDWTNITVINPDLNIKSIYVRCWIPWFQRNDK